MADKPFTIIGVNSDQDLEKTRDVVKEKSLTWRSFQNAGNDVKISKDWYVSSWPTTFLIDKDGMIRYKNVRGNSLDKALEELMAEMNHEVKLVGVDHEAEDAAALKAAKEEQSDEKESDEKESDEKESDEKESDEKESDEKESESDDDAAVGY